LLDELFDRCGDRDTPLPELTQLAADLTNPRHSLHHRFKAALGVGEESFPSRVLRHLLREREVERELFTPELVEEEASRDQWDRAVEHLARLGCLEEREGVLRLDPVVLTVLEA